MITIYTKHYCPFCVQAKNLLSSIGASYKEVDITDSPEKVNGLAEKSGLYTVPQIFVGEKCLGGYTDIAKLNNEGKLKKLCVE